MALFVGVASIIGILVVGQRFGLAFNGDPMRVVSTAQLLFRDGCAPAALPVACRMSGAVWVVQSAQQPWSVASEQKDDLRFELRRGDRWAKDASQNHAVERSELVDPHRQPYGQPFWFAFTMTIEPGERLTSPWLNLGQLHNSADPGELSPSPPWAQRLYADGTFAIVARWTTENPLRHTPHEKVLYTDPHFVRGQSNRFVYLMQLDPYGSGMLQAWRNSVKIIDYKGPLGYPDKVGPYFKFGLYRGEPTGTEAVVGHYRNIGVSAKPLR